MLLLLNSTGVTANKFRAESRVRREDSYHKKVQMEIDTRYGLSYTLAVLETRRVIVT